MKKYTKTLLGLAGVLIMSCFSGTTAFAAGWVLDSTGWWYDNGDGTWPAQSWKWLDGNQDGVAECYYFNENGYCLTDCVTPNSYQVNADGAWMENSIVQTLTVPENETAAESTGLQMKITVNGQELTATLEDNATARAIAEQLPLTLPMLDLYGREMCYRFENAFPANEVNDTSFEVGDIIYWPPRHSFVILYHQDGERFEMQKIGHINADAAVVESMFGHGNVDVTFEMMP